MAVETNLVGLRGVEAEAAEKRPVLVSQLELRPTCSDALLVVSAAHVPGLPVLPRVARRDGLHQPPGLHVLQRLVHVSERQLRGGSQPLPGPASVR